MADLDLDAIKDRADSCESTMGDVLDLIGAVDVLRELTQTCVCWDGNPENYEGLHADCPVHGAVRAYAEASAEIEQLRSELAEAQAKLGNAEDAGCHWECGARGIGRWAGQLKTGFRSEDHFREWMATRAHSYEPVRRYVGPWEPAPSTEEPDRKLTAVERWQTDAGFDPTGMTDHGAGEPS